MHSLRVPALIVLLLIPNTTWRDWRIDAGPQLRALIGQSAMAVMTARTAETGRISSLAGARTFLAGARMGRSQSTAAFDYPVLADNLDRALKTAGFAIDPIDPASKLVLSPSAPSDSGRPVRGRFVMATAAGGPASADSEIGQWRRAVLRAGGALVVASPNPSPAEYRSADRLTPVLIWQPTAASGVLTSPSTRRAGLIANTDIAPTIAALAGARLPGPSYGLAARCMPASDPPAVLSAIANASRRQERDQRAVPYIALALACLVAVTTWRRVVHPSRGCLALTMLPPAGAIAMLALPTFGPSVVVSSALAAAIVYGLRGSPRSSVAGPNAIAAVGALCIAADATFGHCAYSSVSLLGYSPAEGARYYGLGDEAMGVLCGATVLVAAALARAQRGGRFLAAAVWLLVAAILGLPTLGAKAGGLLAALVGLAAQLVMSRSARRFPAKLVLVWSAAAVLAGVGALVLIGRYSGSHVSQTVAQARTFGAGVIWSVAQRKLAMDLHLAAHSVWMLVLLSTGTGTWLLARRAQLQPGTDLRTTLQVGAVVTAACLVLNDAGVVAAGLCSLFVWSYAAAASSLRPEGKSEEAADTGFRLRGTGASHDRESAGPSRPMGSEPTECRRVPA